MIPRFQRAYSWDGENVEEFWTDALRTGASGLFIGPVVVFEKTSESYGVVDGQQRLTTITIALCAVRDKLLARDFDQLGHGLHQNFIERPDYNSKKQYVLQTETSYPYLQEQIQSEERPADDEEAGSQEEENIALAARLIRGKLEELVPVGMSDKLAKKALVTIRDQLLALTAIFVVLENEEDAYAVFETLNARGKDLEAADLTKSLLLNLLKQKNQNVDRPKERWNKVMRSLEQYDINPSTFLLHFWLSREDYTSKANLYSRVTKKLTKDNAKTYLNWIESDSSVYSTVYSPEKKSWSMDEKGAEDSLHALLIFGVSQPAPVLLAALRGYLEQKLKLKDLKRILGALESYHFMTTAMLGRSSSGGISKMYATTARAIYDANDKMKAAKVIDELIAKLRDRIPDETQFITAFDELRFAEGQTSHRKLVRYIIGKVDQYEYPSLRLSSGEMSIEHLLSQNPADSLSVDEAGKIGNLLLVEQKFNSDILRNSSFNEKRRLLRDGGTKLRSTIDDAKQWTAKEIDDHTKELAISGYRKIWKF